MPEVPIPVPKPVPPPALEPASRPAEAAFAPVAKRVRTSPISPSVRPRARARRAGFQISPEIAGGIVLAAAAGLALSGIVGQPIVAAGIAAVLLALAGLLVRDLLQTELRGLSALDGFPLVAGVVLGLVVPLLGSGPDTTAIAVGLALVAAVGLAWSTKELLGKPQRVLLAVAGAILLAGPAIAGAIEPAFVGTLPWLAAILLATPWPAALASAEIWRRKSTSALRRELVRAERDIVRHDYERSLAQYDRAIAATRSDIPGAEIPWYGKGASLVLLGRYEEALRAIDTALDINPRNEVAWVNKGNAFTKMGRLIDALRCFNAAIKVNPGYEVAWNNKGNGLARLGKYEEALACYERALQIDPGYRGAWVNKGFVLTKLGRFDEAATCADRALSLDAGRHAEPA